jgi:hypothetical protein
MLGRLQQRLSETYQAEHGYDVRDFLITDRRLAQALSGESTLTNGGETLLVHEDDAGLSLSLYLEDALLRRVEAADPLSDLRTGQLDDLCKVIEGLSHFNYVVWRAGRERELSLLELELQAEVDKFVSTMQLAMDNDDAELVNSLHSRLFSEVRFHESLDDLQLERYRAANEYAARFCRRLKNRLVQGSALKELRKFYRLPLSEKISHIHTSAWTSE